MNYLRVRILEPILIPLVALALIAFGILNLSRLFLAAGGTKAVAVAAGVAATILAGATIATTRERLNRGSLLVVAAVVGIVLSGAGILAQQVDINHEHQAEAPAGGGATQQIAATIHETAVDINFKTHAYTVPAGNIKVVYMNDGNTRHTFTIEGFEKQFLLEVPTHGSTATGVINLKPGKYTFYCDVPGHRAAGMEGTLTVTEAQPGSTGQSSGGGGGSNAAAGSNKIKVTAVDINFPKKQFTAKAGDVTIEYVDEGQTHHTLTIEGMENDFMLSVDKHGDTDTGTVNLKPGKYTLYCTVPGHRAAGMEATLTVT